MAKKSSHDLLVQLRGDTIFFTRSLLLLFLKPFLDPADHDYGTLVESEYGLKGILIKTDVDARTGQMILMGE
jgi:hypothetical protein